ncbi:hypothetical protein QIS74_03633 [Colletotrichum tabaci]|uniref:Uncharacterized protein n=1 Tax=Colletotrichum tabaci TaxID=1209068 RepID=A0AAV9TKS6_9PEZI
MEHTAIAMDGTMNATANIGNILEARILVTSPSHLIKKHLSDWSITLILTLTSPGPGAIIDLAIVTGNMSEGRSADECTVEEVDDDFSLCTDDGSPRYKPEGQELAASPASKVKYRKSLSWRPKCTFMATSKIFGSLVTAISEVDLFEKFAIDDSEPLSVPRP